MVYILILNYNNTEDTIECVMSILEQNDKLVHILIIDNASTDNSYLTIKNWVTSYGLEASEAAYVTHSNTFRDSSESESNITLLGADKNNGYAAGNNIGIRYVLKKGIQDDYIWILNNDTVINKDTLQKLIQSHNDLADRNIALLGSKILNSDFTLQSVGDSIHQFSEKELESRKHIEVEHISGCSIFFKMSIVDMIGLMPEEYFLYYEETDWIKSIRQKGFRIFTSLESELIHKHARSTGGPHSPSVMYYMTRNQILFHKKYLEKSDYVLFILKISARNILRTIYYFFKKIRLAKAVILGTVDGICGKTGKKGN